MAHQSGRDKIVHMMNTYNLHILLLQETHVNTNSVETHDGYKFYFSTDVTEEQKQNAEAIREQHRQQAKSKGRGRGQGKGKGQGEGPQNQPNNALWLYKLDAEQLGTGAAILPELKAEVNDVDQHSRRAITMSLTLVSDELSLISREHTHRNRDAAPPKMGTSTTYCAKWQTNKVNRMRTT
jgi:hypothetical protein